jgi:hypothetical protein
VGRSTGLIALRCSAASHPLEYSIFVAWQPAGKAGSFSLGIADAVTVLAMDAPAADGGYDRRQMLTCQPSGIVRGRV